MSDSPVDDANVLRFLTGAGKQEALVETASVILFVPFQIVHFRHIHVVGGIKYASSKLHSHFHHDSPMTERGLTRYCSKQVFDAPQNCHC